MRYTTLLNSSFGVFLISSTRRLVISNRFVVASIFSNAFASSTYFTYSNPTTKLAERQRQPMDENMDISSLRPQEGLSPLRLSKGTESPQSRNKWPSHSLLTM